jgi:hypothetical protein
LELFVINIIIFEMDFGLYLPVLDSCEDYMDGMFKDIEDPPFWNEIPNFDENFDDDDANIPCVKTEHSYSMNEAESLLNGFTENQEFDSDSMILVNPNHAMMSDSLIEDTEEQLIAPLSTTIKTELFDSDFNEDEDLSSATSSDYMDSPVDDDAATQPQQNSPTFILTYRSNSKQSSSHPTIIVTKMHQPIRNKLIFDKDKQIPDDSSNSNGSMQHDFSPDTLTIKTEDVQLPPSPPNSDSEVTLSPQKSSSYGHTVLSDFKFNNHDNNGRPMIRSMSTNLIPSSDVLVLTEEEKRTLIAEGYPVPTKLPLLLACGALHRFQ